MMNINEAIRVARRPVVTPLMISHDVVYDNDRDFHSMCSAALHGRNAIGSMHKSEVMI